MYFRHAKERIKMRETAEDTFGQVLIIAEKLAFDVDCEIKIRRVVNKQRYRDNFSSDSTKDYCT